MNRLFMRLEYEMKEGLLRDKLKFFLIKNIMIKINKLK